MRNRLITVICSCLALNAFAYEVRKDSEGDIVVWKHPVVMTLDRNAAAMLNEPDAIEAITAAAKNLDDATPGVSFSIELGAPEDIGFALNSKTNTNSILVLDDWPYAADALAVTLVTLNARTNEILDADVAFNASSHQFKVLTGAAAKTGSADDVQNTITHEFGHVLGLMHSAMEDDLVMYPSAAPGEINKRMLKEDDRQGLLSLYAGAEAVTSDVTATPRTEGGCSTSGLAMLLMPLMLLFFRRQPALTPVPVRARRNRSGLALIFLLPFAARAEEPVDSAAQMQVVQRVSAVHPLHKGLIVTTLTLETRACLQGSCSARETIVVPGGRVGDLEQVIVDNPVPVEGQVLVLTRAPNGVRRLLVDGSAATRFTIRPPVTPAQAPAITR